MRFKKYFLSTPLLILSLMTSYAFADAKLVSDPNVIEGKLANGLSYSLFKSNDEEKDNHDEKVAIRLYVKIGSLEENDEQKGYAHLVEHLGFRDSKNFTHKQKSEFLENLGLHTNAYTTYNRTVYYINDRKPSDERLAKNLQLFRDFADGMFITKSDFEVERKIVLEELRLREAKKDGISERINKIYDNGQYLESKRPIGTIEVLKAATQSSVTAFFKKWYQPQHMHFIVTGQIEPKKLEAQIEATFGDMVSTDAKKLAEPKYKLPTGNHFVTADDATSNNISIFMPLPELEANIDNADAYQNSIAYDFIMGGIDSHLHRRNDADGKIVPSVDASFYRFQHRPHFEVNISHKEGERNKAIEFVLGELAALRQNGFDKSQYENQIDFIEKRHEKPGSPFKHDGKPRSIANLLISNMDEGYIHVSEDAEAVQAKDFLDHVTMDAINQKLSAMLKNKMAMIVVSREEIAENEQQSATKLISDFNDLSFKATVNASSLFVAKELNDITLKAGKIEQQKAPESSNFSHFTLSNGAQAYLFKRKKEKGYMSISAYAKGGRQSIAPNLLPATYLTTNVIIASGFGGLNQQELSEYVSKKRIVLLRPFLGSTTHGFTAKVEKSESLDDLFKLLHMSFYQGKIHQEQFNTTKKSMAKGIAKWRTTERGEHVIKLLNGIYKKGLPYVDVSADEITAVTQEDVLAVYKNLYGDLSKYHFVIAGDFDEEEMKTYLEKYIANIPTQTIKDNVADIQFNEGELNIRSTNNPKEQSQITLLYYNMTYEKTYENNVAQVIAAKVLTKRIYDIMRKEEGLTYGVGVRFNPENASVEPAMFRIGFSAKPSNEKRTIEIVRQAFKGLSTNPISEKEFEAQRDKLLEQHQKVRKSNASNVGYVGSKLALGSDLAKIAGLEDEIKNIIL